jgi:hypothetical protein
MWAIVRIYNGGCYIIFGDTEREKMKRELEEIKELLISINNTIKNK